MKHIYISGGASGIGEASVRLFCKKGWHVSFSDLNAERGQSLAAELGENVFFFRLDSRDRAGLTDALKIVTAKFGPLKAVFANAGIHRRNNILNISDAELDLVIDTNIKGTVHTLQASLPFLIESGGGSVVINASDQSKIGKRNSFAYGMSKGALGQITKSLALDMAQYSIRVNAVCPGTIYTPLVESLFERIAANEGITQEELIEGEKQVHPIGRMGQANEVASLVYFLASDDSSFCTGGLYSVDGGLTAQ